MRVKVFDTTDAMGLAAAKHAAEVLNTVIAKDGTARLLLSTGASQFPFFKHFVNEDIDWSKVEMFHLDEYVGIPPEHPASFQKYLRERFVNKVNLGKYHLIDGQADPAETIRELTALIAERPIDIGLIGIGENGHIAFNDPPVADFQDPKTVKIVELDEKCRMQQVHDGCFKSFEDVPTHGLTITVPGLMRGRHRICVVPGKNKAAAIKTMLNDEINESCPATILRKSENSHLFIDLDSASLL